MYPYIHIVLSSYTVMALIGGFFSLCFLFFRLERFQIKFTSFLGMFICCVIGGIMGSKLLFAVTQLPWLIENFSLQNLAFLLPQSGLVFYGGLFGVIFSIEMLTKKDKELRKRVYRLCVPAMPLFHSFGRIGCFLTGCCYGKKLQHPIMIGALEFKNIPVQLIEALAELIIFILIYIVDKNREEIDLLKFYLLTYASIRFLDEFLRGDDIRGIYYGLSTAQWISILIIVYYIISYIRNSIQDHYKSNCNNV